MKRFLSWLALIGFVVLAAIVVNLAMLLGAYLLSLYDQLSVFLKIVAIVIGGSFFLGLTLMPSIYGAAISVGLCDAISKSKNGARYIVVGVLVILYSLFEMILVRFGVAHVAMIIYAIVLMVVGRKTAKE